MERLKKLGVQFISTIEFNEQVLESSRRFDIPIICGVQSYNTAYRASVMGALALKFYPTNIVSPSLLETILCELSSKSKPVVMVAGGVTRDMIRDYIQAGASHFCIGYDCNRLSPSDIQKSIRDYEDSTKISLYQF